MSDRVQPTATAAQIEAYRRAFQQRQHYALESREKRREAARQAIQSKAPTILAAYPSVQRAYLFGSIVRPGAFHSASDIDIALEGTTAADYFAVWRELDRALPDWTVDVREITDPSPFSVSVQVSCSFTTEHTEITERMFH